MVRSVAVVVALSLLVSAAAAQTPPVPGAQTPTRATAAKKPAPQGKGGVKPAGPVETGPCQLGVVAAIDDKFAVQKIGITVFGNELAEAPVEWGYNDIVVERVRAAAPAGTTVRRIAYPKGAFDRYYNPPETLFGNSRGDFVAIVQQIIGNAHCERYIVIVGFQGTSADSHQPIKGMGIVNRGSPLSSATNIFANLMVQMFDGKTLEMQSNLSRVGAALADAFKPDNRKPVGEIDNSAFPESAAAAAPNAMLRDRTRAVLAAHLDRVLPRYLKPE
jgi:hypothetical protein